MQKRRIVTTRELGKIILKDKFVPTPIYINSRESAHIIRPRTIFAKRIKRG